MATLYKKTQLPADELSYKEYIEQQLRAIQASIASFPLRSYTVATLPTSGEVQLAYVTDAAPAMAWGAVVVTGGAPTTYLVWYNGANWTVVGK